MFVPRRHRDCRLQCHLQTTMTLSGPSHLNRKCLLRNSGPRRRNNSHLTCAQDRRPIPVPRRACTRPTYLLCLARRPHSRCNDPSAPYRPARYLPTPAQCLELDPPLNNNNNLQAPTHAPSAHLNPLSLPHPPKPPQPPQPPRPDPHPSPPSPPPHDRASPAAKPAARRPAAAATRPSRANRSKPLTAG